MNNKQKATLCVLAVFGVAGVVQFKRYQKMVCTRFPEIDPKIARKAYRTMFMKAATNQYDTLPESDEDMDKLFLAEVIAIENQK